MTKVSSVTPRKSTIVRPKKHQHLALRVLETLIPALVERHAAQRFFMPRRHKFNVTLPLADSFTVRSGKHRLRAWSWGAGPAVLLVHGWEGHAGQLSGFVQPLVNRGFRVVAMDLPAHGHSSGRRATILDLAEGVCDVAAEVGPVHAVIAHSLGGAATALALRPLPLGSQRLTAHRVVLLAPPEGPAHFVQGIAPQLGLSPERGPGIARRVRDLVGVDFADLTIPHFAHRLNAPLLLMQDPSDRVVPWAHAQAIAGAWPGAQLRPAPGLGHRRILADPQVIAEAVAFISEPISETKEDQAWAPLI